MNSSIKYTVSIITFIILYFIFSIDFYSSVGVLMFVFFSIKFFIEIGQKIEIRDIMILMAILQWIIGPLFAYKFFNDDIFYYMAVDIDEYMSYVVPATSVFALGLYLPVWTKPMPEYKYLDALKIFVSKYKKIDITLLSIGVISELIVDIVPTSIRFVLFLLSGFRFVGLYFLFLSNRENKKLIVTVILGWLFLTALKDSLFHELLLWLTFFLVIVAFIIKPTMKKKLIYLIVGVFLVISIQTVKYSYREAIKEGAGEGVALFSNLVQQKVVESDYVTSESNLSAMVTRINQGWIIARIMSWTPSREPFAEGETIIEAFKSAFMPRILFPNKIKAGGRTYFTRFTGKDISGDTSMGLGLLGEAYANYGIIGGAIFMFIIGFFYNWLINKIYKIAKTHPAIIFFIPLIFLQVVKAEIDFSVILNHLVKSIIVVWFMFWSMNKVFKIKI